MNRSNPDDGLKLDDYTTVNQHVDSVTDIELDSSVAYGQRNLNLDGTSPPSKFVCKAGFIGTFKKPRTQRGMDFDGRANNSAAALIELGQQGSL